MFKYLILLCFGLVACAPMADLPTVTATAEAPTASVVAATATSESHPTITATSTATSSTTGELEEDEDEDEASQGGDDKASIPISTAPEQALLYAKEDRSIWLWQPSQAPRQLTVARPLDNPENETAFLDWVMSPDGRYLAYSHGRSPILSVEPEGGVHIVPLADRADSLPDEETLVENMYHTAQLSPPVRLISLPGMLAWSPNSQQLAFVSYHELPTGAVYVASLPNLTPRRVADWSARALMWRGTILTPLPLILRPPCSMSH